MTNRYWYDPAKPARLAAIEATDAQIETNEETFRTEDIGGGGGGGDVLLIDPGNVWVANTPVTEGYRILATYQYEERVFEAVGAGTTVNDGSVFPTDYNPALFPLAETSENVTWRYLGIVGQVPWTAESLLPGVTVDADGYHVASNEPISEAETFFQLLGALADSGNTWAPTTGVVASDRITATVSGAPRVFEAVGVGTTGGSEPAWVITSIGIQTSDGSATWAYLGRVGEPDTTHPIFVTNTAGDADWYLDQNNGSGFRFNQAADGVADATAGITEMTTEGFRANRAGGGTFAVNYNPFQIIMSGLPTADPTVAGQLWNSSGTLKISAG